MSLQDFYYIYAIVFMTIILIILIMMGIGLFYIKNKVDEIHLKIDQQIENLKHKPADVAMDLGTSLALGAFKKFRQSVFGRKK